VVALAAPPVVALVAPLAEALSETGTVIEPVGYTIEPLTGRRPVEATATVVVAVVTGPPVAEVTGLVMVQGQSEMVRVVAEETV